MAELGQETRDALFPPTKMFSESMGGVWREPAQGGPGRNYRADPATMKPKILDGIASGLFPAEIAQALGIVPGTIREWRRQDPEFDQMCVEAESVVTDQLEREAIRRAARGVLEPVVHKGEVVMYKNPETGQEEPLMQRRYSDGLLQFLLRGRRAEVYGDRTKVEGSVGIDLQGSRDTLMQKLNQAAERVAASTASLQEPQSNA